MLLNEAFKIVNASSRDTCDFTVEFNLKLDFNMKLGLGISTSKNGINKDLLISKDLPAFPYEGTKFAGRKL